MSMRKERKQMAADRRLEIQQSLLALIKNCTEIEKMSVSDSMMKADAWLLSQVKERPQMRTEIMFAAKEFMAKFMAAVKYVKTNKDGS